MAISTALQKFSGRCAAHPRLTAAGAAVALVLAAALGMALRNFAGSWRGYDIRALGVHVELPAQPAAVNGVGNGSAVYEAKTERLAIVLAAWPPAGTAPVTPTALAERSMGYLGGLPDVSELRYQTTPMRRDPRTACRISATFLRGGIASRAVGFCAMRDERFVQVLCLFSSPEGRRDAERVLTSVELAAPAR